MCTTNTIVEHIPSPITNPHTHTTCTHSLTQNIHTPHTHNIYHTTHHTPHIAHTSHTHSLTHTPSHTLPHTHSLTHAPSHTHSLTHSLTPTPSHTHHTPTPILGHLSPDSWEDALWRGRGGVYGVVIVPRVKVVLSHTHLLLLPFPLLLVDPSAGVGYVSCVVCVNIDVAHCKKGVKISNHTHCAKPHPLGRENTKHTSQHASVCTNIDTHITTCVSMH